MDDKEKKAIEFIKSELQDEKKVRNDYKNLTGLYGNLEIEIILNLIEKQKNIIDSIKRILEDEELDYCDTLDEIYHFYEEVVNNDR